MLKNQELNSIFEKPPVIPVASISNPMAEKNHVKQHFIPVCYLRGFSRNDKTLYVYDKQISKSYCKAFEKIGYADNLYRIDKKYLKEDSNDPIDENYYETEYFAKNIESEYNRILIDIRRRALEWLTHKNPTFAFSSNVDKDHFAAYVGIQYLRLPWVREMHYSSFQKAQDKRMEIIKAFLISENPELEPSRGLKFKHDERYGAVLHSFLYTDTRIVNTIQDRLLKKSWAILASTENNLFTSDNPLVVINRLGIEAAAGDLTMRGAQILFPIAGNLAISMWDHDYFDHEKHVLDSFNLITSKEIRTHNLYQYLNARQHVYQAADAFSIIKDVLFENDGAHMWYPQPGFEVY